MTVSAAVPVAFEGLFFTTAAVLGLALAYLTYYRFKIVLRENFPLDSTFNLDSLLDLNAEAILTSTICIALVWPVATYLFDGRIDANSDWGVLVVDTVFLLPGAIALRTVPQIKEISTRAFAIATAVYCVVFVVLSAAAVHYSNPPAGQHNSCHESAQAACPTGTNESVPSARR